MNAGMGLELMPTGLPGLDELLGGGVVRQNAVLVEGPPGSGKTTLAIQSIYQGAARYGEPGIIISFEETPRQLLRDTRAYGWELEQLQAENKVRILCTTPEILDKALDPGELLDRMILELQPARIVVDSLIHIIHHAGSVARARTQVLKLILTLKRHGLTAFLINELQEETGGAISQEAYLVDAVLRLGIERPEGEDRARHYLEVRKSRGQEHREGRHSFKFTRGGVEVFPQPQILGFTNTGVQGQRRTSGLAELDLMLGGGFLAGTTNLAIGNPGSGKTVLGAHFIAGGVQAGEKSILVTLREPELELEGFIRPFGIDLAAHVAAGMLGVWYASPATFNFDELMCQLDGMERQAAVQRLVIDGLNEIETTPGLFARRLQMIKDFCYRYGITSLLLYDSGSVTGTQERAAGFTAQVDTTILMQLIEAESTIRKVMAILKMKGSDHDKDLVEYRIGPRGIAIADKLLGLSGIMSGSTQGRRKQNIERVLQPLTFIEEFAAIVGADLADRPQQANVVQAMGKEAHSVAKWLKSEYGME